MGERLRRIRSLRCQEGPPPDPATPLLTRRDTPATPNPQNTGIRGNESAKRPRNSRMNRAGCQFPLKPPRRRSRSPNHRPVWSRWRTQRANRKIGPLADHRAIGR